MTDNTIGYSLFPKEFLKFLKFFKFPKEFILSFLNSFISYVRIVHN